MSHDENILAMLYARRNVLVPIGKYSFIRIFKAFPDWELTFTDTVVSRIGP